MHDWSFIKSNVERETHTRGWGHSVLKWVTMCVRKSEWKVTFSECVEWITQLGYLNRQICEKGYIFKNTLKESCRKRCFTQSVTQKGVWFSTYRDHSDSVFFSEVPPDAHAYPRKVWVRPLPEKEREREKVRERERERERERVRWLGPVYCN